MEDFDFEEMVEADGSNASVPYVDSSEVPLVVSIDKVTQTIFGLGRMGGSEKAYKLIQEVVDEGYPGLQLFLKKKGDENNQITQVRYEFEIKCDSPKPLDGYDAAVFEAVCSLAKEGCMSFSPRRILELMTGRENKSKTDSPAFREVDESLEKMSQVRIHFLWGSHAWLKGIDHDGNKLDLKGKSKDEKDAIKNELYRKCITSENLLNIKSAVIQNKNGTITRGYILLALPELYRYACVVGQIATIEPEYLDIPGVQATRTSIQLTHYIARRIKTIKYQAGRKLDTVSPLIKMETVFDRCNISITNRTQAKRVKDTVFKILDHYTNLGIISDYKVYTRYKSAYKVEIIL